LDARPLSGKRQLGPAPGSPVSDAGTLAQQHKQKERLTAENSTMGRILGLHRRRCASPWTWEVFRRSRRGEKWRTRGTLSPALRRWTEDVDGLRRFVGIDTEREGSNAAVSDGMFVEGGELRHCQPAILAVVDAVFFESGALDVVLGVRLQDDD
jgi:hypothetical protein